MERYISVHLNWDSNGECHSVPEIKCHNCKHYNISNTIPCEIREKSRADLLDFRRKKNTDMIINYEKLFDVIAIACKKFEVYLPIKDESKVES